MYYFKCSSLLLFIIICSSFAISVLLYHNSIFKNKAGRFVFTCSRNQQLLLYLIAEVGINIFCTQVKPDSITRNNHKPFHIFFFIIFCAWSEYKFHVFNKVLPQKTSSYYYAVMTVYGDSTILVLQEIKVITLYWHESWRFVPNEITKSTSLTQPWASHGQNLQLFFYVNISFFLAFQITLIDTCSLMESRPNN